MGLFGGSTTTTTNEKFDSGPSSFQKPYLDQAFGGAQSAFKNSQGTPYYQGDTYAKMSPEARAALEAMRGFASGTGLGAGNSISAIGSSLVGNIDRSSGLIDDYLSSSSPEALTAQANKFANDPFLQQRIDAAAGDVRRNLTENILPSIDRNASAGGNINSSRAGIASGIAQRGAQTDIMNIGANMRSEAFDRGLSLAKGAAESRLTAADAFGNLGRTGIDALGRGAEVGYGAFDRINQAGALEQLDRQGSLDADFKKWQGEDQREWDILSRYMGIVGSNQWGQSGTSSGTSKTKEQGSIFNSLIGGALSLAGSGLIPGIGKK